MQIAYQSSKGNVRDKNEDYGGVYQNRSELTLALITDGIGGNNAGEVASKLVVEHLGTSFEQTSLMNLKKLKQWLVNQLVTVNQLIVSKAKINHKLTKMGTTLVFGLINNQNCLIGNIGDSRAYLYRNQQIKQVTEDHSYVNELVKKGELTASEAKNNPYKNVITKSLGINDDAEASFFDLQLQSADQLLLCTDGLTNMVSDEEIAAILATSASVTSKCQSLVDLANSHGGTDNITVLLIDFDAGGEW